MKDAKDVIIKINGFDMVNTGARKAWLLFLLVLTGCENFISVGPPDSRIVREVVFKDYKTANAAVAGIYHELYYNNGFAGGDDKSISYLGLLSSDEIVYHSSSSFVALQEFYRNEIVPINTYNFGIWASAYNIVYLANSTLEGLMYSENITNEGRDGLEGEARFIRAFCYFYLTNLYGDVPLITSTDFNQNRIAQRTPQTAVYEAIIEDLKAAKLLLPDDYAHSHGERVRVNNMAAAALLARVYLYRQDWMNAEIEASAVIDNTAYLLESDLNRVFLKDSREAVWQLMPTTPNANTNEGARFIINAVPVVLSLTADFVDSFDEQDARKSHWIGIFNSQNEDFHYPYKYKLSPSSASQNEYSMVLRLAEQYLIRAEASVHRDNLSAAITDVDIVRNRAGLQSILEINPEITETELLLEIEHQRRLELFTEWGHRWLDLKRTGRAGAILSQVKPRWDEQAMLYPIPESEIINNPNLKPQNPGY